jgi:L-threonylcarbamoyladenylate synthase
MATIPPFVTATRPYGTRAIAEAAALISAGHCVAVPTETVYGLAGDATNGLAVAAIYAAKGRPSFNPLIVHVEDLAAAEQIAHFDDVARDLARRFWPGPLTLVLPIKPGSGIASIVTAGLGTIALRVPAHRAMQALLRATGKPLAAPSANASGLISPTRADHVLKSLNGRIAMIIDDGASDMGMESTIIAVSGLAVRGGLRLLRPGPIDLGLTLDTSGGIEAPGQMTSHYAPRKPLRLSATEKRGDEYLIGFGGVSGDASLSETGSLEEAAARLFDLLHRAEDSAFAAIAVAPIPKDGLGLAINDRLSRAAA